ncbi:hypothetical protein CYMTET_3743 [Cymbomonas tetramitiformis]|uniref:Transmembrane protein n=1 Tax=Cymbomonas tetramitiformis TaxID=36881 RepID=A0AAE0H2J4_9CHLO|nr:hypothetical protein CYMTET_3743 [Cymbomonas tetramitiformis]
MKIKTYDKYLHWVATARYGETYPFNLGRATPGTMNSQAVQKYKKYRLISVFLIIAMALFFLLYLTVRFGDNVQSGSVNLDPAEPITIHIHTGAVVSDGSVDVGKRKYAITKYSIVRFQLDDKVTQMILNFETHIHRPVEKVAPNHFNIMDPPKEYYIPATLSIQVPIGRAVPPVTIIAEGKDRIEVEMLGLNRPMVGKDYLYMPQFTFRDDEDDEDGCTVLLRAQHVQQDYFSVHSRYGVVELDDVLLGHIMTPAEYYERIRDFNSLFLDDVKNRSAVDQFFTEGVASESFETAAVGHSIQLGHVDSNGQMIGGGDVFVSTPSSGFLSHESLNGMFCLAAVEVDNVSTSSSAECRPINGSGPSGGGNATDGSDSNENSAADNATVSVLSCYHLHQLWSQHPAEIQDDASVGYMSLQVVDGGIYITAQNSSKPNSNCSELEHVSGTGMAEYEGMPGGFDIAGASSIDRQRDWMQTYDTFDVATILSLDGPKELRDAGIWVYCTLQTYVLITFRWIGSFSAGLLSPEITNVRARLVPNVCPYCPAANAFGDIDVQGQIGKVFGAQLELDPNPSESIDDVVVLVGPEEIIKTPGIDGVWGSYMSEYAPMYRYKEASNQDTVRTNMKLSDAPRATLLLSVIIGMIFGVMSSWILSCSLNMLYEEHVENIHIKARSVKTWGKLHVMSENDPDSAEQNAKSSRDSQYVHIIDQGNVPNAYWVGGEMQDIFGRFTGSERVPRDELQQHVNSTTYFTSTFFFHIELAIEWMRRSIIPPLELFICSIPMKQTLDGKLDQSAEGDGDEAHSGEDADVLKSRSNFVPLRKFKEAYYRFCSQQGLTASPIAEGEAALLRRSGLRVVKDPFSEVCFTGIRWMQKPSQEYKRLKDKTLMTNSVTMFLKNNCLATGLDSDAIPLQQLAFRYKQFCYSMVLPKLQQVHITPNTPQVNIFSTCPY